MMRERGWEGEERDLGEGEVRESVNGEGRCNARYTLCRSNDWEYGDDYNL